MQGGILKRAGWIYGASGKTSWQFADVLSECLVRWPELSSQSRLLDLCCFGLYSKSMDITFANEITVKTFINTCFERKAPLTATMIPVVLIRKFDISEKCDLLSKIGECCIGQGWFDDWGKWGPKINKVLENDLHNMLRSTEWFNLLRALSYIPPLDAMREIPSHPGQTHVQIIKSKDVIDLFLEFQYDTKKRI
jgi:hypothetical protein